jgi:hypothetical protein
VRFVEHRAKSLLAHMSVVLRGRQIRMSEHLLYGPQVRAPVEQVRGEGVPQGVGVRRRGRSAVEEPVHVARAEAGATTVQEHGVGG